MVTRLSITTAADARMPAVLSDEEQRQFGHLLSRVSEASVRWT